MLIGSKDNKERKESNCLFYDRNGNPLNHADLIFLGQFDMQAKTRKGKKLQPVQKLIFNSISTQRVEKPKK